MTLGARRGVSSVLLLSREASSNLSPLLVTRGPLPVGSFPSPTNMPLMPHTHAHTHARLGFVARDVAAAASQIIHQGRWNKDEY